MVLQGSAMFDVLNFSSRSGRISPWAISGNRSPRRSQSESPSLDALTVELDRATRREIGKIAKRAGQAETAVAAKVLAAYVKQQAWFADKIEGARKSPLVPDRDVEAFFRRWQKPASR